MFTSCLQQVYTRLTSCLHHVYSRFTPGLIRFTPCLHHVYTRLTSCLHHFYTMFTAGLNHIYVMFELCLHHVYIRFTSYVHHVYIMKAPSWLSKLEMFCANVANFKIHDHVYWSVGLTVRSTQDHLRGLDFVGSLVWLQEGTVLNGSSVRDWSWWDR